MTGNSIASLPRRHSLARHAISPPQLFFRKVGWGGGGGGRDCVTSQTNVCVGGYSIVNKLPINLVPRVSPFPTPWRRKEERPWERGWLPVNSCTSDFSRTTVLLYRSIKDAFLPSILQFCATFSVVKKCDELKLTSTQEATDASAP